MSMGNTILTFVGGLWKEVLYRGAAIIDACSACCTVPPQPACADKATCNKYFDATLAEFEQSECCDCPCPGRKAFPPSADCYRISIAAGPVTGILSEAGQPDIKFIDAPDATWNSCDGDTTEYPDVDPETGLTGFKVAYLNPDGSIASLRYMKYKFAVNTLALSCSTALLIANVQVDGQIYSPPDTIVNFNDTVNRCDGGVVMGAGSGALGAGGTATITINGTNCDGDPCWDDTGNPASVCGTPMILTVDCVVAVDPDDCDVITETVVLYVDKTGDCKWDRTQANEWGASALITRSGENCPGPGYNGHLGEACPPNYFGGCYRNGSEIDGGVTWNAEIFIPAIGSVTVNLFGSCPSQQVDAPCTFLIPPENRFIGTCFPEGIDVNTLFSVTVAFGDCLS